METAQVCWWRGQRLTAPGPLPPGRGDVQTRPLRPRGPWLQRTLTSQASPRPSVLWGPGPLLGGRCSFITPNPGHWVRVTAKPARAWRSSRSGCRGGEGWPLPRVPHRLGSGLASG